MELEPLRHEVPDSRTPFGGSRRLWDDIEDALGKLAGLASANGAHALATTITIAALEASQTKARLKRG